MTAKSSILTPQDIALLVLIRQSFLSTLKSGHAPDPPCLPLCAFLLERIYSDVTGADPDMKSFMARMTNLFPPAGEDSRKDELGDLIDKSSAVREFFINLSAKKKPDSIIQLFKDLRRRLWTDREEDDRPFEPEAHAAVGWPCARMRFLYEFLSLMFNFTRALQFPLDRRSVAGVFARRRWLTFSHMSYDSLVDLTKACVVWSRSVVEKAWGPAMIPREDQDEGDEVDGMPGVDSANPPREPVASTSAAPLLRETQSNRVAAFDEYQRSRVNGHSFRAHHALHRFFDYRFTEIKERGHLQHALVNLAALHAEERGFEQARTALVEAVKLARQQGDKSTITSCLALMRRIDFMDPDHRMDDASIEPPDPTTIMGSQDHLWQAKEAVRIGKPVNVAMASLYRAKASLIAETVGFRFDRFKVRWDAVSSEIWSLLGSPAVANVHRDLAMDPDIDLGNERSQQGSLCAVLTARARELSHCGAYSEALLLLLSFVSVELGLPKQDLNLLQAAIYDVFRNQATREEFQRVLYHLDAVDAAKARSKPTNAATDVEQRVHSLLQKAQEDKDAGNVSSTLHGVLEAMSLSDSHDPPDQDLNVHAAPSQGRTLPRLFLHAQVLLADTELEYNAWIKARHLLQDIEGSVRKMDDPALLADWSCVMAKACQAQSQRPSDDQHSKRQAVGFLKDAVANYNKIRHRRKHTQALGDLAMALNSVGSMSERDETLRQWKASRDLTRKTQSEDALLHILWRVQKWTVSQDAQLCVETEPSAMQQTQGMQTTRAVQEWVGPTFVQDF